MKNERLVSRMECKTNFLRRLKQLISWPDLPRPPSVILWRIYAAGGERISPPRFYTVTGIF